MIIDIVNTMLSPTFGVVLSTILLISKSELAIAVTAVSVSATTTSLVVTLAEFIKSAPEIISANVTL